MATSLFDISNDLYRALSRLGDSYDTKVVDGVCANDTIEVDNTALGACALLSPDPSDAGFLLGSTFVLDGESGRRGEKVDEGICWHVPGDGDHEYHGFIDSAAAELNHDFSAISA